MKTRIVTYDIEKDDDGDDYTAVYEIPLEMWHEGMTESEADDAAVRVTYRTRKGSGD